LAPCARCSTPTRPRSGLYLLAKDADPVEATVEVWTDQHQDGGRMVLEVEPSSQTYTAVAGALDTVGLDLETMTVTAPNGSIHTFAVGGVVRRVTHHGPPTNPTLERLTPEVEAVRDADRHLHEMYALRQNAGPAARALELATR
jgi:hypothetical protein